MAELRARITNEFVLNELEKAVRNNRNLSKNQLINDILALYFSSRHEFFLKALPPIVENMCEETLMKQAKDNDYTLKMNTNILLKVLNSLDEIRSIFYEDIKKRGKRQLIILN